MTAELQIRRYEPRDADPVWTLHEWALRDAGTDPDDVPGVDDLRRIEATYLDAGGSFLLGTDSEEKAAASIEIGRFDSSQIVDARYVIGVGAGIAERPLVERPHRVGVSRLVSSDP